MKKITRKNLHSFCRTCLMELKIRLSGNPNKYNIHQLQELSKLLMLCTAQMIDKTDNYPKFICQSCFEKLQTLQEFRSMALKSLHTLSDIHVSSDKATYNTITEQQSVGLANAENSEWLEFEFECDRKTSAEYVECKASKYDNALHPIESDSLVDISQYKMEANLAIDDETEIKLPQTNFNTNGIKVEPLELKCDINGDESANEADVTADDYYIKDDDSVQNSDHSSDMLISDMKAQNSSKTSLLAPLKLTIKKSVKVKKREAKTQQQAHAKMYEIKFRCELCPKRFISQENLDAHTRTHQGLKPFQCTECSCSYAKKSRLRLHIREKHTADAAKSTTQKQVVCSFEGCGKIFQHESSYKVHYRIKHSNTKPVYKTYICEDCGRTCKNLSLLRKHRYTHRPAEEYPYKCEHCGKRFISQSHYKEHLLRHAGIKKFECPHCGMKKTTRHELRVHINYHTKERQWRCPICPSVFSNAVNLRRHDRVVHQGIRSFTCRFCNESFGKPDTLKHHEMRHTGEKPHACSICDKRFIQAVALKTHMKTHFKNGVGQNLESL